MTRVIALLALAALLSTPALALGPGESQGHFAEGWLSALLEKVRDGFFLPREPAPSPEKPGAPEKASAILVPDGLTVVAPGDGEDGRSERASAVAAGG